jgi:hypothetical protein
MWTFPFPVPQSQQLSNATLSKSNLLFTNRLLLLTDNFTAGVLLLTDYYYYYYYYYYYCYYYRQTTLLTDQSFHLFLHPCLPYPPALSVLPLLGPLSVSSRNLLPHQWLDKQR